MKRILFSFAFVAAIGGAFATQFGPTSNITVGYKDNTLAHTCKTTTCSNVVSAFSCAQPTDFGSGFYKNNGLCDTPITVYRAE